MNEPMIMWSVLEEVEYESKIGKSLKNTLRKFDKEELFEELMDMICYYTTIAADIPYEKRIKSIHSCELKYVRYFPSKEVEKVFNDILGLRITLDSYDVFDMIEIPPSVTVADMRNGKAKDDGYRGIHVYVQKSHLHLFLFLFCLSLFRKMVKNNLYMEVHSNGKEVLLPLYRG